MKNNGQYLIDTTYVGEDLVKSYPNTTATYTGEKYTSAANSSTRISLGYMDYNEYTSSLPEFAKVKGIWMPAIERVIFNKNATIVIWSDETKMIVKRREGDKKSNEIGLAMAIAKKYYGNRSRFLKAVKNGKVYK